MNAKLRDNLLIAASIIVITFLHYFTLMPKTGLHDFYRRLYYIPIIFSAFRFRLKGGIAASIAVVTLYAPHMLIYFGKIDIDIINQFLEIAMFIIIGGITGMLVESEARVRRLLEVQITKLTNLENYTGNILDSILNGVIAVDRSLKITSINKEGKNILNQKKEMTGEYVYKFFEDGEKLKNILNDAMQRNKGIQGYEVHSLKCGDTRVTVRLHAYPLKNILNALEGMVLVIEDITHVKRLENQVRRAEKLSAIGELASGIAHEIRNPLGIIKTISQTINKDIEDEEIKEGLEIIEHEIDRANKVIQGLLDFAKPSIFNSKIQSIHKIISEVLILMNKYAQQHRVEIMYEVVEDSFINVDADKIKQAFVNIIFNAIQAMPEGGNLNIQLENEDGFSKISFSDEGVGIDENIMEKIFEPFYTTKEKGTGLGLSITHRIIEEHKGYIEIDSKVGVGTTVIIYLPNEKIGGEVDEKDSDSR
ncbi:ATP-binding protein [Fonticella tunisiensis]|uniref:histidine kinase n=1 Tax=Fonticella tunisiensis TaxID=1096341 RepID=A0A4V3ETR2_9CLOT|nr:ATP-binding protein [Fonticella tunisiensis]TDT63635.1 nitrogen-specific signal transduction histidine kinase [Fonticella tunisiensis]